VWGVVARFERCIGLCTHVSLVGKALLSPQPHSRSRNHAASLLFRGIRIFRLVETDVFQAGWVRVLRHRFSGCLLFGSYCCRDQSRQTGQTNKCEPSRVYAMN